MQDNKAAYATLTVALYNWELHIKNSLKSTVLIDLLKAAILVKLTKSGKPFHTLKTLQAKKITLALLLLGLKSLYACPLVGNVEN